MGRRKASPETMRGTSGPLRHPKCSRYRCSLPGLAGFAGHRCTEPEVPRIGGPTSPGRSRSLAQGPGLEHHCHRPADLIKLVLARIGDVLRSLTSHRSFCARLDFVCGEEDRQDACTSVAVLFCGPRQSNSLAERSSCTPHPPFFVRVESKGL